MDNAKVVSRTKNTSRNIVVGLMCKIISLILPFVSRTILIYTLGTEYAGLGSLFTSILTVLNVADLGFNAAIIYNMYKPLAENDVARVKELLSLYRFVYKIVGIVIFIIGMLIIPFIRYLIKEDLPSGINIYILYIIFLLNSVVSYLMFAYKEAIVLANQRQDLSDLSRTVILIVQYVAQCILLLAFKNYYFYAITALVSTVFTNIIIAMIADKKYPEYIEITGKKAKISKDIREQLGALLLNRVCAVTRNSIDSIILSSFLGLIVVAIYNNYFYVFSALYGIISVIGNAMTASIGNSIVTESVEKNYHDLKRFSFMHIWMAGWMTICLLCIYQPFMIIWMGKGRLLHDFDVVLLSIYFFVINMCSIQNQYITAAGKQRYFKKGYIVQMLLNIILNICLGKLWGTTGIILATIITIFGIDFVYTGIVLFRIYFLPQKKREYFMLNIKWSFEIMLVAILTYMVCSLVKIESFYGIFCRGIICLLIPNLLFFIIWQKSIYFKEGVSMIKRIIQSMKAI